MKKSGFTLIELMVVISIIALLSSIILASLQDAKKRGIIGAGLLFESTVNAKIGDGLIAEYNFDEPSGGIAFEATGSNNNLALVHGTQRIQGVVGGALSMDATREGAFGDFKNFDVAEGTISIWLRPYSFHTGGGDLGQTPILSIGPKSAGPSYSFEDSFNAYMSFGMQGTNQLPGFWDCSLDWGGYDALTTTETPQSLVGRWNHLLVSWNKENVLTVFLNGKQIGQIDYARSSPFFYPTCGSDGIPGYTSGIELGNGHQTHRYSVYDMDRVRIYNKAFEVGN